MTEIVVRNLVILNNHVAGHVAVETVLSVPIDHVVADPEAGVVGDSDAGVVMDVVVIDHPARCIAAIDGTPGRPGLVGRPCRPEVTDLEVANRHAAPAVLEGDVRASTS